MPEIFLLWRHGGSPTGSASAVRLSGSANWLEYGRLCGSPAGNGASASPGSINFFLYALAQSLCVALRGRGIQDSCKAVTECMRVQPCTGPQLGLETSLASST